MKDDLIRRGELKKELHSWAIYLNRPSCYSKDDADYIIDYMPAVDAVEVVRCRDCKYCDPENFHCDHACGTAIYFPRKPDDFCSYGERRTNNGEIQKETR